jgi:hypothetical protein
VTDDQEPGSGPEPVPATPTVEALTRRLLDAPADWRAQPIGAPDGQVSVAAVVSDLDRRYGGPGLGTVDAAPFRLPPDPAAVTPAAVNELRCVLVASWVLAEPALAATGRHDAVRKFLASGLAELASIVPSASLVDDPDRREELARRCLAALGLVPAGETEAQAADRLAALDSAERARVLAATREAERRAEEVRQAMHAKAAAEAAAKASRE